jgi:hypothetical protein
MYHSTRCHVIEEQRHFQHLFDTCGGIKVESSCVLEHGAVPLGSLDW